MCVRVKGEAKEKLAQPREESAVLGLAVLHRTRSMFVFYSAIKVQYILHMNPP